MSDTLIEFAVLNVKYVSGMTNRKGVWFKVQTKSMKYLSTVHRF